MQKSHQSSDQNRPRALVPALGVCIAILAVIGLYFLKATSEPGDLLTPDQAISKTTTGESQEIRIATLLPFAADQLIALGVTPVCVPGLSGQSPESWRGLPTVQIDHSAGPNLEQLVSSDPDLIISGSTYAQFLPSISKSTGAEVVIVDIDSIQSVFESIMMLGQLSNRELNAEKRVAEIQANLNTIAPSNSTQKKDVLALFGTPHSFYAFMQDSYLGDLVHHCGGQLGPPGLTSHTVYKGLAPLSMESVIEFDPDLLLVLFHGPRNTSRAMFEGDPLWSSLRAIKEGHVYFLSDDLFAMRSGSDLDSAMNEISIAISNSRSQSQ